MTVHVSNATARALGVKGVAKKHKYGAKRVTVDGYKFDSIAESERYGALRYRLLAKEITDLNVHPQYPLDVNGVRVAVYEADFAYRVPGEMRLTVEDVKGFPTPEYKLKKKLFLALYPHCIFNEVPA